MMLARCVLAGFLALLAAPGAAQAGRVIVTGHDADLHCSGGQQCNYVKIMVAYARAGAPDPAKPVLVLDRGSLQVGKALDGAFGAGVVPREVVEPRSAAFGAVSFSTSKYSAIIVASDTTCGGCDLNDFNATPDSDAINARKGDIAKFFNAGGGIVAFSGANHGGADSVTTDDVYYNFLPLPVGAAAVSPPFTLTPFGTSMGLTEADVNCCPTHNSFGIPPSGSELKVAETDSKGLAETLVAEGSVSGGTIVKDPPAGGGSGPPPTAFGPAGILSLPSNKKCVSRRNFRIRIKKPKNGTTIVSAIVTVNGKRVKTLRGKRVTAPVDLRGLPKGTFTVKITVLLSNAKVIRGTRKYRTCAGKKGGSPNKSPA